MGVREISKAVRENAAEVRKAVSEKQDWATAEQRFSNLYRSMSDPGDPIWNANTFLKFKEVYIAQREKDKGMSNIITRTMTEIPEKLKNDVKVMFLQIAEVCCLFNGSHKVNFEANELPANYPAMRMIPGKPKGVFTYSAPTAALYKKTSLTFDYWVPKFIEWTDEVRSKKLIEWKGQEILSHESCTDFMRICLLFLSDPKHNPPIAKAEEREAFIKLAGEEFVWIKKSARREDIVGNNKKILSICQRVEQEAGVQIPLEAWNRLLQLSSLKALLK